MSASYFLIAFLITTITINGGFQSIIIPILDTHYPSIYFILSTSSFQFCFAFGIIYLIIVRKGVGLPPKKLTVFGAGLFNGLMSVSLIYASKPTRTPVVLQSILSGLVILPTVVLTKLFLKKKVRYNCFFSVTSIICLIVSLGISTIPLIKTWTWGGLGWICVYIFGTFCRSAFNVLQERYFIETDDTSLKNKIVNVFYIRLTHFIIVALSFWMEYAIGYKDIKDHGPIQIFVESVKVFITKPIYMGLLEAFVVSYILLYMLGVYLNTISTNYNMITAVAATPANAVFFAIFPKLNPGIQYPPIIFVPSLIFAMISIALWIKGETNGSDIKENDDGSECYFEFKGTLCYNLVGLCRKICTCNKSKEYERINQFHDEGYSTLGV